MKWLITGANGQLGRCIQDILARLPTEAFLAVNHQSLDITEWKSVRDCLSEWSPDVVINAAAYTAVDAAESNADNALQVNQNGPAVLARCCQQRGIPLVHISTDYVFDGTATTPYTEAHPTSPLGVYGQTKLAGEQQVQRLADCFLIIRTAWVFSEYSNNFVKTMLRLGKERDQLSIVADQMGTPTYAGDLARTIVSCVQTGITADNSGVYHYCGGEVTSWFGFAQDIFEEAKNHGLIQQRPLLRAINTDQFPTAAKRPAFSVLNADKINREFSVAPGDWKASLKKVVDKLAES